MVQFLAETAALQLQHAEQVAEAGGAGADAARQSALQQLQGMIGMIEMLQDKTRGNVSIEDGRFLERMLYQLRMAFMERSHPPQPPRK